MPRDTLSPNTTKRKQSPAKICTMQIPQRNASTMAKKPLPQPPHHQPTSPPTPKTLAPTQQTPPTPPPLHNNPHPLPRRPDPTQTRPRTARDLHRQRRPRTHLRSGRRRQPAGHRTSPRPGDGGRVWRLLRVLDLSCDCAGGGDV